MNLSTSPSLRALLVLLATAFSVAPAQAVVVLSGCASASFCSMQELLDGATIRIDDKLFSEFENFSVQAVNNSTVVNDIPEPTASDIRVYSQFDELGPLGVADEIGLAFDFRVGGSPIVLLDGAQSLGIHWEYSVMVVAGGQRIVDNTLMFPVGIHDGAAIQNTVDLADNASLQVIEQALDPATGQGIVRKIIEATDSAQVAIVDHRDFAPVTSLRIVTDINANGGNDASGTNLALDWMLQSFSQEVSEPAPVALLTLGLLALTVGARRGRQRHRC